MTIAAQVLDYLNTHPLEPWDPIIFAQTMEIPLSEVYANVPEKEDVLRVTMAYIDGLALDHFKPEELAGVPSPRERVLELLLQRFEAMQPYQPALRHVWTACQFNPKLGMVHACQTQATLARLLEQANFTTNPLVEKGLYLAYMYGLYTWVNDTDSAMGATMAALDQALEKWWEMVLVF